MENKEKNNGIVLGIVIGVFIALIIFIIGIIIYNQYYVKNNNENTNNTTNQTTEKEENIVLNEEDVKKWLNNNDFIETFFVLNESNFDKNTADKTKYGDFLGWCLMFAGLSRNAIENTTLDFNTGYNYQYSYSLSFIKKILNDSFNVGIDMIDTNLMNKNFEGYAHFLIDNDKFTVQVIATGADIFTNAEINNIKLNDNKEIVINYNMFDCIEYGGECQPSGHRELVLKKTADGYNLLRAYKVD